MKKILAAAIACVLAFSMTLSLSAVVFHTKTADDAGLVQVNAEISKDALQAGSYQQTGLLDSFDLSSITDMLGGFDFSKITDLFSGGFDISKITSLFSGGSGESKSSTTPTSSSSSGTSSSSVPSNAKTGD